MPTQPQEQPGTEDMLSYAHRCAHEDSQSKTWQRLWNSRKNKQLPCQDSDHAESMAFSTSTASFFFAHLFRLFDLETRQTLSQRVDEDFETRR